MRVGRINAIKLIPYKDVKTLLRYFSIKGVARESGNENDLSKINTLQPYDNKNINQKISTRDSLNKMVIDTIENRALSNIEKNGSQNGDKSSIELIKTMNEARRGSRVNTLNMLEKTYINSNILNIKNDVLGADGELQERQVSLQQENEKKTFSNNKLEEYNDSRDKEKLSSKQENGEHSLIEKYAQRLKELDEKSEEEQRFI